MSKYCLIDPRSNLSPPLPGGIAASAAKPRRGAFPSPGLKARYISATLIVAAACALLAPGARGQGFPHWSSTSLVIDCTSQCHVGHQAEGGTLTPAASNVNLCQSCHNPTGLAGDFSIATADKAIPRVSGTSHAFDVAADNAAAGAQVPLDPEMAPRIVGGNLVCSTCHNQHRSEAAEGGTPLVGNADKVLAAEPTPGTGLLTAAGTFSGPSGVWYLVEIVVAGNQDAAEFCYSKDRGISWRPTGCDPPASDFTPSQAASGATPVALDDGFGAELTFGAGTYELGERWEFSAAYPFLRVALGAGGSNLCIECHSAWNIADAGTWTGNAMSHPVGVPIPAGDFQSPPLDGNGVTQGGPGVDANASNDLLLWSGNVECLTCHGVHHVDSNTQTEDVP